MLMGSQAGYLNIILFRIIEYPFGPVNTVRRLMKVIIHTIPVWMCFRLIYSIVFRSDKIETNRLQSYLIKRHED